MIYKFKGYLIQCIDNEKVYEILRKKPWSVGDQVMLPPLRISKDHNSRINGEKVKVYMCRKPIIKYGSFGYVSQKKWIIDFDKNDNCSLLQKTFNL